MAAVGLPTAIRAVAGSGGAETTSLPTMFAAGLLLPFGAALPPLPAAALNKTSSSRLRSLVPVGIGLLMVAAVAVARIAPIPLGRATLLILIAVLATTLLPVEPYDGARLGKTGGRIATVGLAVIAMLQTVDWI